MPPNKIIDQYTDRSDLSAEQKWRLRHMERFREMQKRSREKRGKAIHASEMRAWRLKNPDSDEASQAKYRRKVLLKKIATEQESVARDLLVHKLRPTSRARRRDVLLLFEKGKSISDIVIYMNIPFSVVTRIIESEKNPQK